MDHTVIYSAPTLNRIIIVDTRSGDGGYRCGGVPIEGYECSTASHHTALRARTRSSGSNRPIRSHIGNMSAVVALKGLACQSRRDTSRFSTLTVAQCICHPFVTPPADGFMIIQVRGRKEMLGRLSANYGARLATPNKTHCDISHQNKCRRPMMEGTTVGLHVSEQKFKHNIIYMYVL
jgi:hypothetical protein